MAGQTSSDPNVFILPDLGEGVHEAELISWKVKPGDRVDEHDIVAEMETDKALVEVPSPRDGVIKQLFGNPGDILKVGEPAWTYEGAGEIKRSSGGGSDSATMNGSAAATSAVPESVEREDDGTVVGTMSGSLGAVSGEGKALATPAVRRLARDLGVDIDAVRGTGIGGRVTDRDVRSAAEQRGASRQAAPAARREEVRPEPAYRPEPKPVSESPSRDLAPRQHVIDAPRTVITPAPSGESQVIPIRGVRRTIANRLRQSVDRAVHFTVMDDADVSALDAVREKWGKASGEKLSYLPFVISALIRATHKFPALNAHVDDENEQIVRHRRVHMGMAADTDQGLSVPVIFNADEMGVLELGRHIAELARAVRDRSIPREQLSGSTITISNVGSYAGKYATPIINYPEVAILAAGRVYEGVLADRGAIKIAKLLPLSLTCDHRCVDGADAARALAYVVELLKDPEQLLTPARD